MLVSIRYVFLFSTAFSLCGTALVIYFSRFRYVEFLVSVPSHIIDNTVPHSNFPDPIGGSAIYESGSGRIITILPFLEGTDPTFLIRIRGLNFYSGSVFFSWYRPSRFIDFRIFFGPGFFI
jgi:hypothetical protein